MANDLNSRARDRLEGPPPIFYFDALVLTDLIRVIAWFIASLSECCFVAYPGASSMRASNELRAIAFFIADVFLVRGLRCELPDGHSFRLARHSSTTAFLPY